MTETKTQTQIPVIVCCGETGRAVIYGYVDEEPTPGEPVRIERARMILQWRGGVGLLGIAAAGPPEGSGTRITAAVPATSESTWREYILVTAEAAERLDAWPAC